jgi:hypothetical protein
MLFQAYHGVTAAQHQTNFNKWSAQGYRMISLSVYGDPGNALYAAVWVQRPGPGWVAIHGVDAAGYQSFFTKWSNQGYHAVLDFNNVIETRGDLMTMADQIRRGVAWVCKNARSFGGDPERVYISGHSCCSPPIGKRISACRLL